MCVCVCVRMYVCISLIYIGRFYSPNIKIWIDQVWTESKNIWNKTLLSLLKLSNLYLQSWKTWDRCHRQVSFEIMAQIDQYTADDLLKGNLGWYCLPNLKFGTFLHTFSMLWHSCLLSSHGRSLPIVLWMADFLINAMFILIGFAINT